RTAECRNAAEKLVRLLACQRRFSLGEGRLFLSTSRAPGCGHAKPPGAPCWPAAAPLHVVPGMPPDGYEHEHGHGHRARHAILHVLDSLETGGLERVVVDLAIAQRDHGHRVAVFSLTGTTGLGPELEAAGIHAVAGNKRRGIDLRLVSRLRAAVG